MKHSIHYRMISRISKGKDCMHLRKRLCWIYPFLSKQEASIFTVCGKPLFNQGLGDGEAYNWFCSWACSEYITRFLHCAASPHLQIEEANLKGTALAADKEGNG